VRVFFALPRQPEIVIGCAAWFLVLDHRILFAPGGNERWGELASARRRCSPSIVATQFRPHLAGRRLRPAGLRQAAIMLVVLLASHKVFGLAAGAPGSRMCLKPIATPCSAEYTQQGIELLMLACWIGVCRRAAAALATFCGVGLVLAASSTWPRTWMPYPPTVWCRCCCSIGAHCRTGFTAPSLLAGCCCWSCCWPCPLRRCACSRAWPYGSTISSCANGRHFQANSCERKRGAALPINAKKRS
jgi:hypothetical protein